MLVSVVIPSYNRADTLPQAIQSVLAQTYQDFEIIIVDDCSNDNTSDVIQIFTDARIRCIRHEQNKGGGAARNTGIKFAQGKVIAFLDSDDEWLMHKLAKQMVLFEKSDNSYGCIYTGLYLVDRALKTSEFYLVERSGDVFQDLMVSNFIASTSSILVKKDALLEINGFDETMPSCQDWDLYLRLSEKCLFGCVPQALVNHHISQSQNRISNNNENVVKGHRKIQEKFHLKFLNLPKDKQLEQLNKLSFVYVSAGALGLSLKVLCEALSISGNPLYVLRMIKRIWIFIKSF